MKLLAGKEKNVQPSVTEEELKVIIEEIEDEGVLNEAFDVSCKIISIDGKKHCVFNRKGGSDV